VQQLAGYTKPHGWEMWWVNVKSHSVIKTEGKSGKVWPVCSDWKTWSPSSRIAPRTI